MKRMLMIVLVLAVAVVTGCASYNAKGAVPTSSNIEENKLVRIEKEGITVIAFPILNESESKKYFDANLLDRRILAVYLDISNRTADNVRLISANLEIKQSALPMPIMTKEEAYKILKKEWAVKTTFWWFFGVYVGAPISALHTSAVNTEIEEDLNKKILNFGEIKPKEMSQGFVWFKIPEEATPNENNLPKGMILLLIVEKKSILIRYDLLIPSM